MSEQQIDWQHLESDYRAGVLSLRYLAAKYKCSLGAITRRAKRDGWCRAQVEQGRASITRENTTGENNEREHHEAVPAGENSAGENTGENSNRRCSLTTAPKREQPRPNDVHTLGREYHEAQRQ